MRTTRLGGQMFSGFVLKVHVMSMCASASRPTPTLPSPLHAPYPTQQPGFESMRRVSFAFAGLVPLKWANVEQLGMTQVSQMTQVCQVTQIAPQVHQASQVPRAHCLGCTCRGSTFRLPARDLPSTPQIPQKPKP